MIASSLLAVSVVGVSGTILASYANDKQSITQRDATVAAETLMDEVSALPYVAASASDVGLTDFGSYSDSSKSGQATVASASVANTKTTANGGASNPGLVGGVVNTVVGLVGGLLGALGGGGGSSGGGTSGGGTVPPANTSPSTSMPIASTAPAAATIAPLTAGRVVTIVRRDTINGPVNSTGDLATVTVDATIGGQVVRVRRLVSSTEAGSAAAAANRSS